MKIEDMQDGNQAFTRDELITNYNELITSIADTYTVESEDEIKGIKENIFDHLEAMSREDQAILILNWEIRLLL